MKNRFLKMFSLFAVLCCSVLVFTGCTVDLTEEQKDKVMTVVDNADVFMKDVLKNLDLNNKKMDREEAFKALQDAQLKLAVNYDNIWSNIRITNTENGNINTIDEFIQTQDGNNAVLSSHFGNQGELSIYTLNYSNPIGDCYVIDYTEWLDESGETASEDIEKKEGYPFSYYLSQFNYIQLLNLTSDDVLTCETLEDGTVNVALIYEQIISEGNETSMQFSCGARIIYQLKDGRITKVSSYSGTLTFTDENPELLNKTWSNNCLEYTIEYGSADIQKVESKYAQAKEYAEANLELE